MRALLGPCSNELAFSPAGSLHSPSSLPVQRIALSLSPKPSEFIDYTTSMITDKDPLRGLSFY